MAHLKNRREFLQFITNQTVLMSLSPIILSQLSGCITNENKNINFQSLKPTSKDSLVLAKGLTFHIISRWGDTLNKDGDLFGFNNDFTSFLAFETKTDEGLLWVNHESIIPEFIHNKQTNQLKRSITEVIKEQDCVGGSILHIKKINNQWLLQKNSKFNRRLHAKTKIPFSQNTVIQGESVATGTLANCASGQTPWKTFLTSEENYDDFYGEASIDINSGQRQLKPDNQFGWSKYFPMPPEHYGWVVEVNPFTGEAKKQVLLGRAPHEGATVVLSKSQKAVVYMGEDRPGGFIFKFISTGKHLDEGTLYAADTINGKWLPLEYKLDTKLQKVFKNQLDVLTYAHQSAEIVGATPQDRPEDIEINKQTGDVIIALTNNPKKGNLYGSLFKIQEQSGDFDSLTFSSKHWFSGGIDSGLACPDNLCFDNKGNLWVTVDMSEKDIGKKEFNKFGNNGLFYIPTTGPQAGQAFQVASAPVDAELTGPCFSPDYRTLFLSVQHPGSRSRENLQKLTSTWPDGAGQLPKSAVVAIQGETLDQLVK